MWTSATKGKARGRLSIWHLLYVDRALTSVSHLGSRSIPFNMFVRATIRLTF